MGSASTKSLQQNMTESLCKEGKSSSIATTSKEDEDVSSSPGKTNQDLNASVQSTSASRQFTETTEEFQTIIVRQRSGGRHEFGKSPVIGSKLLFRDCDYAHSSSLVKEDNSTKSFSRFDSHTLDLRVEDGNDSDIDSCQFMSMSGRGFANTLIRRNTEILKENKKGNGGLEATSPFLKARLLRTSSFDKDKYSGETSFSDMINSIVKR